MTFTITNTGECDGAEIAQMYVGHERSHLFGPKKELKGFVKVFLKKGESQQVTIPFDDKTFRYYNVKTNGWEVEGGAYQIYIGASVEDIRLRAEIEKESSGAPLPYDMKCLPSYASGQVKAVSDQEYAYLYGRDPAAGQSGILPVNWIKMMPFARCIMPSLILPDLSALSYAASRRQVRKKENQT